MTSMYEDYGPGALERLKDEYDIGNINRQTEWGNRDQQTIRTFLEAAGKQKAIAEKTAFKWFVLFNKGHDYGSGKIEFSISAYRVPQVPGNEKLKVFSNEGKRFIGNDRKKEAVQYARDLMVRYPGATLTGTAAELVKPEKGVINLA